MISEYHILSKHCKQVMVHLVVQVLKDSQDGLWIAPIGTAAVDDFLEDHPS